MSAKLISELKIQVFLCVAPPTAKKDAGNYLCNLKKEIPLCVKSSNYDPERARWIKVALSSETMEKLEKVDPTCKSKLLSKLKIKKSGEGEAWLTSYPYYVEEYDPDAETKAQANCHSCAGKQTRPSSFNSELKNAKAVTDTIVKASQKMAKTSETKHPLGWPVSKDGFSYSIPPNKAYITSRDGLRKLNGIYNYTEGTDFGTLLKKIPYHAMKAGRVIKAVDHCYSKEEMDDYIKESRIKLQEQLTGLTDNKERADVKKKAAARERKVDKKFGRGCNGRYGNQVIIMHGDGSKMYYSHTNKKCDAKKVKIGQRVEIGQILGCVGNSGSNMVTHLDVRYLKPGGKPSKWEWKHIKDTKTDKTVKVRARPGFESISTILGRLYDYYYKKGKETFEQRRVALVNRAKEIREWEKVRL